MFYKTNPSDMEYMHSCVGSDVHAALKAISFLLIVTALYNKTTLSPEVRKEHSNPPPGYRRRKVA